MSGRGKYILDYVCVALAQMAFSLRSILVIPILLRNLGTEALGIWSQVIVTSMLLAPLLAARMPSLLTRFLSGNKDHKTLSSVFLGAALMSAGLGAVVMTAGYLLRPVMSFMVFGDRAFSDYVFLTLGYAAAQSVFLTALSYFLVVGKQRVYAPVNAAWGLGEMALVAVLSYGGSVHTVLLAAVIWQVFMALGLLAYMVHKHGISTPRLPMTREFWSFGGWLVLSHVLFFWAGFGSRYILAAVGGMEMVAVFVVASTVTQLIALVTNPNVTALLPSISAHWNANEQEQARPLVSLAYKLVFLLGMPIVFGLYAYGDAVTLLLAKKAFVMAPWVVPLLALSPFAYGIFRISAYAFWMQKKFHVAMAIQAVGMVGNVLLCVLLIGPLGTAGAVIGVVSAMLIMTSLMYVKSLRIFRIGIDWVHALRCVGSSAIMLAALLGLRKYLGEGWRGLLAGGLVGMAIYMLACLALGAIRLRQIRQGLVYVNRRFGGRAGASASPSGDDPAIAAQENQE